MSDRVIAAADKMYIAVIEFINDWKKGDFELPRLAVFDLEAIEKYALEYSFSKIPTTPEEVSEFEKNNIIKERTSEEIRASWEKLKKMISEKGAQKPEPRVWWLIPERAYIFHTEEEAREFQKAYSDKFELIKVQEVL